MIKINKILLIEDEYIDAFVSKRVLQQMEIANEIIECKNGRDALNLLSTLYSNDNQHIQEPELILLDISMPGMNGIEFLHELKNRYEKDFTIVILSSSDNPQDLAEFGKYQASYYLVKPLTEEKVKKMVERCLQ